MDLGGLAGVLAAAFVSLVQTVVAFAGPVAPLGSGHGHGPGHGHGQDRRPNVLVVMLDDMRADDLAYAPNARKYVGARGLEFMNSFSPFPLCCPARASFMTGKYAHNHGVLFHEPPYAFGSFDDHDTIGLAMQRAGYNTALIGKYLNRYGVDPSKVTGLPSATYVPPGWTDWMAGLENGWSSPEMGQTYDYFNLAQNINGVTTHAPGQYSSKVIADQAIGLIGKYSKSRKPFFMDVTPVAPHHGLPAETDDPTPWYSTTGYVWPMDTPARPDWVKGRFDRTITQPPGFPKDHQAEADISDKPAYIRRLPVPDKKAFAKDLEVTRQRAESIYAWDREFGRIIAELKRTGEYDKTVIFFTSDNGYNLGEHRVLEGKIKPHEPVLRVPLLVAGPGIEQGRRYVPITTMDLTATILDIAGAHLPAVDGTSRLPQMTGPDRPWDQVVLTEGLFPDMLRAAPLLKTGLSERGIRIGRWKYVQYSTGGTEIYDLATDPNELTNLRGDPAHRAIIRELRKVWLQHYDCAGRSCRKPLPHSLVADVAELARIDRNAEAEKLEWYFGR